MRQKKLDLCTRSDRMCTPNLLNGMEVTDVRTFRGNLKHYLALIKEGLVVDVSGLKLCVYTGDNDVVPDVYTIPQDAKDKDAKFAELKRQLDARANPNTPVRYEFSSEGRFGAEPKRQCEKCKKPADCRKMTEDGIDHIVCGPCALKAKLAWNKLEKLT